MWFMVAVAVVAVLALLVVGFALALAAHIDQVEQLRKERSATVRRSIGEGT